MNARTEIDRVLNDEAPCALLLDTDSRDDLAVLLAGYIAERKNAPLGALEDALMPGSLQRFRELLRILKRA